MMVFNYQTGPVPCRYCNQTINRFPDEPSWFDGEGKYYCVSFLHGLTHLPIDP